MSETGLAIRSSTKFISPICCTEYFWQITLCLSADRVSAQNQSFGKKARRWINRKDRRCGRGRGNILYAIMSNRSLLATTEVYKKWYWQFYGRSKSQLGAEEGRMSKKEEKIKMNVLKEMNPQSQKWFFFFWVVNCNHQFLGKGWNIVIKKFNFVTLSGVINYPLYSPLVHETANLTYVNLAWSNLPWQKRRICKISI